MNSTNLASYVIYLDSKTEDTSASQPLDYIKDQKAKYEALKEAINTIDDNNMDFNEKLELQINCEDSEGNR